MTGGKGSHCKIECPHNAKIITIPEKLHKQTICYILKEIKAYSGVTWEQIKNEF